ncbi:MAG: transcriptional regulator [Alphaproteobacteria bacterium HGW-Alphaproteobacteria-2]|nr:MAG: transcriptional regulator [Alphaproteobacteria bacterium HGW-Alphaproteobacteria-2]
MDHPVDQIDISILAAMQRLPGASQREIAEAVNLSQNACWRRIRRMEEAGIIEGRTPRLNREALGLGLVVFTMIRTRHHSDAWLRSFRAHVAAIPEVVDFFRIGGDYDYMLKIVTADMAGFDSVYRRLIEGLDLETVTSHFAMEAIAENRPLPVQRAMATARRR